MLLQRVPPSTHVDGVDCSGDGICSDSDDGGAASSVLQLPSFAPSNASGMPGDLEDFNDKADFVLQPKWADEAKCSEGVWGVQTCGGGAADAEMTAETSGHGGTYGVLSANWGGNWSDRKLQAHMLQDVRCSPCQILCIQEATESLQTELGKASDAGAQEALADGNAERRPGSKFIGVRGPEPTTSLMICGRASIVSGIRLLVFHRVFDGTYKISGRHKKQQVKGAVSRIMVASLKMRFFKIRGGGGDGISGGGGDGDEAEGLDEIKIANVHLHFRTAKRDLQGGSAAYKRFWDLLARYLVEFRPSFLCGDFNMALFCVVPELRARGFAVNVAAWYCWQNIHEANVRVDSCGIFRIGPCQGIRMCFDSSVFGLTPPHKARMLLHGDGDRVRRRWKRS